MKTMHRYLYFIFSFKQIIFLLKKVLVPVVRRLDNAIHHTNHYPVDKSEQNKPRYPLDIVISNI